MFEHSQSAEATSHNELHRPGAASPSTLRRISNQNQLASSVTSPSNAASSYNDDYSGASSVLQTPSPLLDAPPSDTIAAGLSDKALIDSTTCPAKVSTHGDCNDHAHIRGKPVLHVCHWQNCHSSFSTVQGLLQHISQSHLGLNVGDAGTSLLAQQTALDADGNVLSSTDDDMTRVSSQLATEATCVVADIDSSNPYTSDSVVPSTLSAAKESCTRPYVPGVPLPASTAAAIQQPTAGNLLQNSAQFGIPGNVNQDIQTFAAQIADQDTLQSILGLAGLDGSHSGPMACLWDDCPPFDPFAHFGPQCLDDACGLPPNNGNVGVDLGGLNAGTAIDATMLTCDTTCTEQHTHLFPCEPSCSQEHAHIHPMHLHSYSQNHASAAHNVQLDSATAVLKHLLQQHLGVDLTQGLLNVASQQLGGKPVQTSASNPHSLKAGQGHMPEFGTMMKDTNISEPQLLDNKNNHGVNKNCKSLRLPPRRPSDIISPERQSHVCRWHNCSEVFGSVEDLTEHLSKHIGKGKADYECLWEGCQICYEGETREPGRPAKGRVFTTRQKIMRHMQVSSECLWLRFR